MQYTRWGMLWVCQQVQCYFPQKFGDGGKNNPWRGDVPLLYHKNLTLHPIGFGGGNARPQSAREEKGDKNEHSCRGIVSDDDLKIRVAGQFIKNWANNTPIPAPYLHAHWMPACEYGPNIGSMYTDY